MKLYWIPIEAAVSNIGVYTCLIDVLVLYYRMDDTIVPKIMTTE